MDAQEVKKLQDAINRIEAAINSMLLSYQDHVILLDSLKTMVEVINRSPTQAAYGSPTQNLPQGETSPLYSSSPGEVSKRPPSPGTPLKEVQASAGGRIFPAYVPKT